MYEDVPDPRDGVIPGCSAEVNQSKYDTQYSKNNDIVEINTSSSDSSSSNKTHLKRKKTSRSYESIVMKYADTIK